MCLRATWKTVFIGLLTLPRVGHALTSAQLLLYPKRELRTFGVKASIFSAHLESSTLVLLYSRLFLSMPFSPPDSQPHEYVSGIFVLSLSSLLWNVLDGQHTRVELSQTFLKSIVGDTNGPKGFSCVGNTLLSQLFKLEVLGAKLVDGQV